MDLQGILGIDGDVRNGFGGIKVTLRHRRRRLRQEIEAAGRPVAEALGGLRHRHQPDQRHRRGRLSVGHRTVLTAERLPCTTTVTSSAPAMPASP